MIAYNSRKVMITKECLDELEIERTVHPCFSGSGLSSPSKVPKEALFPGLSPLVESGLSPKAPSSGLLQKYHDKIIAAQSKLEKPSSEPHILLNDDVPSNNSSNSIFKEISTDEVPKETIEVFNEKIEGQNTENVETEPVETEIVEPISSSHAKCNYDINLIDFSDLPKVPKEGSSACREKTNICKSERNENPQILKNLRIERLPKPFNFRNFDSGQGCTYGVNVTLVLFSHPSFCFRVWLKKRKFPSL